MVQPDSSNE
jgi:hypothetical protein